MKLANLMLLIFVVSVAPSSAQTTLSLSRESDGTIKVNLSNSEPVAALQLTLNSSSSICLGDPYKSGRTLDPAWTLMHNRKNDSTINVIILPAGTGELQIGDGAILEFSIEATSAVPGEKNRVSLTRVVLASPNAQSIDVSVRDLEWTSDSFAENTFSLQQNFPNPFNPTTTIPYRLERDSRVNLSIYDITGRVVKTLVDQSQTTGLHSVSWNSTDDAGRLVPSGVYFVRLQVDASVEARKMILTK